MLCDDFVAYAKTARGRDGESRYIRRLGALCAEGERFILDNEATDVVLNVEESWPSTLEAALAICRLPYPVVWLENDILYRMQRTAEMGYDVHLPEGARDVRGGLLLVASDDTLQRGRVYSVSSERKRKHPLVNPICLEFDLTAENRLRRRIGLDETYSFVIKPDYHVDVKASLADLESNAFTRKLRNRPKEIRTLLDLEHRFLATVDDDSSYWLNELRLRLFDDEFKHTLRASIMDFQGERRWIIGLLLLLNSRNLYTTVNHSVSAKNQHRSPRVNPRPFTISHKTLKIELTKVAENRMYAQGARTASEMALHRVRGHWKVRRTGVYFWRPHIRGNAASGIVDKTYHVTR